MAQTVVKGLAELKEKVGDHLGFSEWQEIAQDRINDFADATLDHQWIHVDVERARAESPFGGPIAHGYLTLSLVPHLYHQVLDVQGIQMAINYGLNKVRFPSPVPAGSKVRLGVELDSAEDVKGGVQCVLKCTAEIEGGEKPAMVAELVFRYFG